MYLFWFESWFVFDYSKGLEVLDLQSGRPLFALPLSPAHAIHKDINGDGIIDHVHAIVNPGEGTGIMRKN